MSYTYYKNVWGKWIKWGIVALAAIIIIVSSITTFNSLTAADQAVRGQWAQVQNVMQRRSDVILNEVEVVKGYVKHEENVFSKIAEARSVLYNGSADISSKLAANEELNSLTRNVLVIMEKYPDLKASEHFTNLQTQIEGAENRVSVERKRFIEAVQDYNLKVTRFPGNIFARFLGFEPKDYFEADEEAQKAPKVEFGD